MVYQLWGLHIQSNSEHKSHNAHAHVPDIWCFIRGKNLEINTGLEHYIDHGIYDILLLNQTKHLSAQPLAYQLCIM